MHKIQPKDIWLIQLPDTQTNEQTGVRPAVILAVHSDTAISVVVPLTKNLETLRFEYTYKIAKSQTNGLTFDSTALIFHIRSLTNGTIRFKEKIGTLEETDFKKIKELIKSYLAIT